MEYFKSGLKSVLGAQQEGVQPTGAETVERLVDRVQSSTLLDDRRDACRALKALSRKYRIEVGAQSMDALCQVLQMDNGDCEIVGYALDTLVNVTAPENFEEEEIPAPSGACLANLGEQFTEIFIKQVDNVALVLGFLEEYDFRVRWPSVKLLTSLLANKPKDIQEIILVSPMGVSKLMDLLSDSREVIRNDALLLLIQLTKGNANIQKIVAFENAFDRLFDVIREEGYSDGGIVVEDCLLLMLNLIRNNTSNQNFFKEGSYIQRLAPMFILPPEGDDAAWSPQKVSNVHCMLQVVRTLVMPGNPAQVTSSSQCSMKVCGLLEALCNILMASGVPADILTETINSVGEVIRGNHGNQEYFANVMAPSNPPRPAIVVLLMSMVNEKQPFVLRCAVLYCFQCFLFKNEVGQATLVNTLIPSSSEVGSPTLTTGQLLCGGLFSGDALSNWFSAVALSHALVENPAQKEHLLRVLLSTNMGGAPISLVHQCTLLLQQGNKVQSKLGFLMLLSTWMSHCPLAVQQFLSIPTSIPYLTAQVGSNEHDDNEELVQGMCAFLMGICVTFNDDSVSSFSKEKLCQLISKRIGLETFLDRLGEVSKHELYSKAAKHPHLRPQQPNELLLDHEFCRLFKALEGMVIKAVTPKRDGDLLNGSMSGSDSGLVQHYKDLIRDQDREIKDMAQRAAVVLHEKSRMEAQVEELSSVVSQLRDQNMLLRAQANAGFVQTAPTAVMQPNSYMMPVAHENVGVTPNVRDSAVIEAEIARWRQDSESKQAQINSLEAQIQALMIAAKPTERCVETQDCTTNRTDEEIRLSTELLDTRLRLEVAQRRINELEENVTELERVRKDQEDLLELLTDQDSKLNEFKARLRSLGEKLDDDDEDLLSGDEEEDFENQLRNPEHIDESIVK